MTVLVPVLMPYCFILIAKVDPPALSRNFHEKNGIRKMQEVSVTLGFASGDTDLLGLPFLKVTLEPRNYLYNIHL